MKMKLALFCLTVVALVLSACGTAAPAYNNPVVPVTGPTATSAPAAAGGAAMIGVAQNASLGSFLVDSKGMTLYMFTVDAANTSNCTGSCLKSWPPLLTSGAPTAGSGITGSMLGTITRSDGGTQVTYNSMPLYYFAGDKVAGDTNGQGLGGKWYVVDPSGNAVKGAAAAAGAGSGSSSASAASLNVGQNAALGSFLVDTKGMTVYLYKKDTQNSGASTCYSTCATYWPPFLVSSAPTGGNGVTASMLGTIKRSDGTTQVTYNGWPLYYYIGDKAAGDTNGENVQGIWYVITPAGVQK